MGEEPCSFDEMRQFFADHAGMRLTIVGGKWSGQTGRLVRITPYFVIWQDDVGHEFRSRSENFTL